MKRAPRAMQIVIFDQEPQAWVTREKATDVTATDTNMSGMTFKRSLTARPIDKFLALPAAALSDCTQEGH